ncbi:hypothetical protein BOTBODRAFT_70301 [Botryobasidium botryosum FD-172 SS1]|uniref:Uncharacterized protein n=1 Tax=Botryobasidium botryosum (strain FD-172 SS1) TaxID=930990 RepID=A0A067M6T9_BOTB1|nr:hypothetical protein BOTBODRAFT_70301 [Botryobasidium botryosum FD-172 SS1]
MNRIQLRRLGALISQTFRLAIFGLIALLLANLLFSLFMIKFTEFYITSRNIFFSGVIIYIVEKLLSLVFSSSIEVPRADDDSQSEKPYTNGHVNGGNGYHDPDQKPYPDEPPNDIAATSDAETA